MERPFTPSRPEPVRILIVDDDRHARAGVRAFLASTFNCTIVGEAGNGREAITQVESHRPDAVVLDLHMPVLGGLEAARIIKTQWPETAIVVLTMYTEHRVAAVSAGVDAFVCKGDPPATLLEALRGAVQRVGSQGAEDNELRS
ncbi:MAG TPA: response regulator transcription factor [Chloroflexota bacterium]